MHPPPPARPASPASDRRGSLRPAAGTRDGHAARGERPPPWARLVGQTLGALLRAGAHAVTGVRVVGVPPPPATAPRVYFANHASHGDIVLVWATLPPRVRAATRPVAGSDYWGRSALRRFVGRHVFDVLPIERDAWLATGPLARMVEALDRGESLLLFPEGTRNAHGAPLLPFKGGLFHLGHRRPDTELVPVRIGNAGRAMPKGRWFPVPVLCTVRYGDALRVAPGEDPAAFLRRAAAALEALA